MYYSPNLKRRKDLSPELASLVFSEITDTEIEAEVIAETPCNPTPEIGADSTSSRIIYVVSKTKTPYGTAVLCGSLFAIVLLTVGLFSFTTGYRLATNNSTQTLKLTK